jgi:myxalamid-type polyketide synthase MxaB
VLQKSWQAAVNNWLYKVDWQPQTLTTLTKDVPSQTQGNWLIFADQSSLETQLTQPLQKQGHQLFTVTLGEAYQKLDAWHYTIDPAQPQHFKQLLEDIQENQLPLQGIVHLWSLESEGKPIENAQHLQESQFLSVGSTLHLVQALSETILAPEFRFWLVTRDVQAIGT